MNLPRGIWHQFGHHSQTLAEEQLGNGVGVGCVLSPRYLTREGASSYASKYKQLKAAVLIDPEFYLGRKGTVKGDSYAVGAHKASAAELADLSREGVEDLAAALADDCRAVLADGVIAPAVLYRAGDSVVPIANQRLAEASSIAARELALPLIVSVPLAASVTSVDEELEKTLDSATKLQADAWYLGFSFSSKPVPTNADEIRRFAETSLTLAGTGKPVFHQSAGPLSLLSFGFGAWAAGIGHFKNLWEFDATRYTPSSGQGGGGDAPPRFFSTALWGTIVYPDEVARLPEDLQAKVLTTNPYSSALAEASRPGLAHWSRWEANKHLVHAIGSTGAEIAARETPLGSLEAAIEVLRSAAALHAEIRSRGTRLQSESRDYYQSTWMGVAEDIGKERVLDFEYLAMLARST